MSHCKPNTNYATSRALHVKNRYILLKPYYIVKVYYNMYFSPSLNIIIYKYKKRCRGSTGWRRRPMGTIRIDVSGVLIIHTKCTYTYNNNI